MRVYNVELTVSGMNDVPEVAKERIVCRNWQDLCELMAGVCRDTGLVIREMRISQTQSEPFER